MWGTRETGIKYILEVELEESYEESANAANSWPHLHNTHQTSLSLRLPVNSRPRRTRTHTHTYMHTQHNHSL